MQIFTKKSYDWKTYTRDFKYGKVWRKVLERDKNCVLCNKSSDLTVDHIISVKNGGKSTLDNLRILCRSCNTKEGHKSRSLDPRLASQREYMKKWRKLHPGYFTAKSREFTQNHHGYRTQVAIEYVDSYRKVRYV